MGAGQLRVARILTADPLRGSSSGDSIDTQPDFCVAEEAFEAERRAAGSGWSVRHDCGTAVGTPTQKQLRRADTEAAQIFEPVEPDVLIRAVARLTLSDRVTSPPLATAIGAVLTWAAMRRL